MSEREAMTHEMLRRIAAQLEDWNNERYGGCSDPHGDVASLRAWVSELEGSTQPTRADVEKLIADAIGAPAGFVCSYCGYDAGLIADALIARGWLGVSDTPNEGAG